VPRSASSARKASASCCAMGSGSSTDPAGTCCLSPFKVTLMATRAATPQLSTTMVQLDLSFQVLVFDLLLFGLIHSYG